MVWDGPTRKKQVENIGGPVSDSGPHHRVAKGCRSTKATNYNDHIEAEDQAFTKSISNV